MAKVGRPPKYSTPEELQRKVDAYFDGCDSNTEIRYNEKGEEITVIEPKPYLITGLALALGFNSRQSLLDYEGKKEFMDIIKKAKLRIESYAEEKLFTAKNPTGTIFQLKANYGWQDKVVIDQTVNMKLKLEDFFEDDSSNM